MIRFESKETITDYLKRLNELISNERNTASFLKDAGHELHFRYILPNMPEWNPNLMLSPLEEDNQIVTHSPQQSQLELIYTGFTSEEEMGLEKVFSEFAVGGDPTTGHIERDYAYFQETGIDDKVDPDKYKPQHTHFVKKGTANYSTEFHYKTMAYIDRLMQLEGWESVSKYTSYDSMF